MLAHRCLGETNISRRPEVQKSETSGSTFHLRTFFFSIIWEHHVTSCLSTGDMHTNVISFGTFNFSLSKALKGPSITKLIIKKHGRNECGSEGDALLQS